MHRLRKIKRESLRALKNYFSANPLDPFPLRHALKNYSGKLAHYDIRAASNVALLAVPQGMAYAAIAELPIIYGVMSSAIASLVSPMFASSRHTILGPTNATAFMIFATMGGLSPLLREQAIPMLVLLVGLLAVFGALFKIADLLQFVSRSVLVGYITGAATLIIINQLKHLLGIADAFMPETSRTFPGLLETLIRNIPESSWQPLLLGLGTLGGYFFLNKKVSRLPTFAMALVLFTVIATVLSTYLPHLQFGELARFKDFSLQDLHPTVPSLPDGVTFRAYISQILPAALAIAFLASLENTAMSKSLALRTGDRTDLNQDMLSVGMANLATSCLSGMPASGSLTRSALNYNSGAKSRLASIFSSGFCFMGILLLALFPLVSHIPKAVLAALVIGIAISLINWQSIRICLVSTGSDAAVLLTTFIATLLVPLDTAIFIGVAASIAFFLKKASVPYLVEYEINEQGDLRELGEKRKRPDPAISIVHVEGDLFFGAAELFQTQIQRIASDENLKVIILRLKNARHLDATSVLALRELASFMRAKKRHMIISGAPRQVYRVLLKSGVIEDIQEGADREKGESNIFMNSPTNPNIATRNALLRAQQLLGTDKAEVKIYYDPNK